MPPRSPRQTPPTEVRAGPSWIVVGTGRVGSALCRWLSDAGLPPLAVVGRKRPSALARRARARQAWTLAEWYAQLENAAPARVLLAIPDDALPEFAEHLAALRASWRGWCFLHSSGARHAAVLHPLARRGAATGSLHPMMTFPPARRRGPAPSPAGVVFTFEGSRQAATAAAPLVRRWRGRLLRLPAKAKTAYHLAATLVGPGAVIAMAAARTVLLQAGVRGRRLERALAGLRPLLAATASHLEGGFASAWTGALARGDRATIALHRRALRSPEATQLYEAMVTAGQRLLPAGRKKTTGTR